MNRLFVRQIVATAAELSGVSVDDLMGRTRTFDVSFVRQRLMLAIRTVRPDMSYPAIGRALGNRDHTTIIHGIQRAEARASSDPDEAVALVQLLTACGKSASDLAHRASGQQFSRNVDRLQHAIDLVSQVLSDLEKAQAFAADETGELFGPDAYRLARWPAEIASAA